MLPAQPALQLAQLTHTAGRDAALGAYNETRWSWRAGGARGVLLQTYVRVFADGRTAELGQVFPRGWNSSLAAAAGGVALAAAFPVLALGAAQLVGVTWADTFSQMVGPTALPDFDPRGRSSGGPLAVYAADGRCLVLSPLNHFLAAAPAAAHGQLWLGVDAAVRSLPAGFEFRTLAVAGGGGLTDTLHEWGSRVRAVYGRAAGPDPHDRVVSHYGWWSDNGAYLYMYSPQVGCF